MSWLNKMFKGNVPRQDVPSPSTGFFDADGQPVPLSLEGTDLRAVREQVRNAAIRTAAMFGIPSNWLSYEVVTISDHEKAYFQLQVALRIWDEQLWSQSSAFELQVLKLIREGDINVGRAVRAVLWRILPDAGCPYDELSGEEAWTPDAVKTRARAYDRLRKEFAPSTMAMTAAIPNAANPHPEPETAPATRPLLSDDPPFHDTHPGSGHHGGFAATQPFDPKQFKH